MSSQLLVASPTPTTHVLGPNADEFFDGLDPQLAGVFLPLARLAGHALGLPVPSVPIVYHESFGLRTAVELEPRGDRFVLHLPDGAEVNETEEDAEVLRQQIRALGHAAIVPFENETPKDFIDKYKWGPWAPYNIAAFAWRKSIGASERARLRALDAEPVFGHVGAEPLWVQAHPARGAEGLFIAQVQASTLGLCDVSFYVYWDATKGRFRQAQQMS